MIQLTRRNLGLAAGMATAVALTAGALITFSAEASPVAGGSLGQAPAFTGQTTTGETISLSDFADQTVVLEWTNDGCPFVKKHYAEPVRNMQTLQDAAAEEDIVWISVISSAPGKQGYVSGQEAEAINEGRGASPAYTILDPEGVIGRAYDAKTTPQMFVIKAGGEMAYNGAIDSIKSARVSDIEKAENYLTAALEAVEMGEPVATPRTKPYGCSVKY